MTEYLIAIYDAEEPYTRFGPEEWGEVGQAHQRFADRVEAAGGKVIASRALQPTKTATTIRDNVVAEGPYVETKEAFCGYYLIEANDLDQAVAIAKGCPARFGGVEVRPVRETPTASRKEQSAPE
jgi:hypothetical protein